MKKNSEKRNEFSSSFWDKKRPDVTFKEILDDTIPIEWNNDNKDDVVVHSHKEINKKKK